MASKWYSVKTLYRTRAEGRPEKPDLIYDPDLTLIEERVVLLKAKNRSDAISKAEREAKDYAAKTNFCNPYGQRVLTDYLGFLDIFDIQHNPSDKLEIFSVTHLMSRKIKNSKVAQIYIGRKVGHVMRTKRKKFVNREFISEV